MAFIAPVLTQHIAPDPSRRTTTWHDGYVATNGYQSLAKARDLGPESIIKLVTESGLRGRGGAGAGAGIKWAFMPKEKKQPHYLIVNFDESEPGTFKDRFIVDYDPHQLLEGAAIAAVATQCDSIYIYIRGEYHREARILQRAIDEAYAHNIFGGATKLDCHLHIGAGAYIVGEETAMLESLEGKRGWPRNRPPFPAVYGAFGKPTTVTNVETLCCVPHIVNHGAAWFRSMGTPSSPGPKLYGISGNVNNPGVYEHELGITVDFAINHFAGGVKSGVIKAVIPGGISMGVLTPDELHMRLDFDDPKRFGLIGLGTAGLIVMNDHQSMIRSLTNIARFFAHESCGQCTPCREGSSWVHQILSRICDGMGRARDLEMLLELEKTMGSLPGTTICGLADALAWPIRSFINKFYDEFAAACPDEPLVPLTIQRGSTNVLVPMGSNTR